MRRKRLKITPPDYYALWDDVPCPGHAVRISVYEEETRARVCAGVLGCSVRPVSVALLRDYLAWRATQSLEACDPDPLIPFHQRDRAPILRLSALIACIEGIQDRGY